MEDAIDRLTPVELYNDTSSNVIEPLTTINLNETAANFSYLEIFFKDTQTNNRYGSCKVYSPNNKSAELNVLVQGGTALYIIGTSALISGTSITLSNNRRIIVQAEQMPHFDEGGLVSIVRVIGYK